ncbi:MAG TPA: beta-ketoacyl synthase N-terminal-like domain-containing protein, partial [Kiritimatiellia bacterium]|nr:beta-ketoacyl synthase N-terminal-like domain-containing protein [Kiritimatiellia bacterium]
MTAKRSVKKDRAKTEDRSPPCEVAIIGMSCFFPKAGDLVAYWENILNKVDGISEVPADRWDWRDYFDPDKTARDKIYSKWGGFMDPVVFNPMTYGIPPNNLRSIDPVQLLSLEAAHRALVHAGYGNREFDRERTACIFGLAGGMGDFGLQYGFRASLPMFLEAVPEDLLSQLPEWTEDSFPGVLPNVVTGRIANCLNLGGANFTVDAACASALTAVYAGVKEILSGVSSMAIVGAADTLQNPHGFLCFSKTKALTPTGRPKPFDASADGISISEGVGALILKRKDLAVKDGDAIYAVIRGVGSSSDGRGRSLTAPQTPGQLRALANAYAMAGLSIDTVELVEAHGTGTVVGDGTEAESMAHALAEAGAPSKGCAVGSVKSNIGHTKGCAGIAGLIKATLSLHHKVLPATLHVNQPGAKAFLDEASPVYVNTENRPWISRYPVRRAGVNSFGFGGTNFHVVLEEFVPATPGTGTFPLSTWPCELFVWKGDTAGQIDSRLAILEKGFAASTSAPRLRDLARHVYENRGKGKLALTIVAESVDDLKAKLADARAALKRGEALSDPRGIYFHPEPLGKAGKVAFLFPGQGSQRPDMMRDLAILFPELRDRFARADGLLAERLEKRLSDYVYPPPRFSAEAEKAAMKAITETNIAQPSLGVTEIGMCRILETLGVKPDMAAGHSSGEYTALCAAGVFGEDTLFEILEDRGASILASAKGDLGTMMAVRADRSQTEAVLKAFPNVYVANFNSPSQTIISGLQANLEQAGAAFQEKGIQARLIPVSCAFHSPIIEPARDYLAAKLKVLAYEKPNIPVYANLSAAPYPEDRETILHLLTDHLIGCVRFVEQIERMYADGARVFVEVGPGTVLTNLVGQILAGQPHHAVATEAKSPRHDLFMLLNALGQLAAQGVEVFLDRLFEGRETRTLKVENLDPMEPASALSPVAWKVAPDRAWPWREAKPTRRKLDLRPAEDIQRLAAEAAPSGGMPGPAAGGGGSPLADVLVQHQQTMSEFLRQQREVMMAYLRGEAGAMQAVPAPVSTPRAIPAPVAPKAAVAPAAPAPVPAAPVGPSQQAGGHKERLLALVAERTGYPVDMIDPNASIEADLGIDSIKRLEILIAFAKDLPGAPEDLPEQLNTSTTLGEVL